MYEKTAEFPMFLSMELIKQISVFILSMLLVLKELKVVHKTVAGRNITGLVQHYCISSALAMEIQ